MPNNFANQNFPTLPRLSQDNPFYCGPAVIQMLLGFLGYSITQDDLVKSAGITNRVRLHGTTLKDMGHMIGILYPELQFWFKFNSSIIEVSKLVNIHNYPVGVEWQGLFEWSDDDDDLYEDEDDDDDPGHYSVITKIDTHNNIVQIADPDRHYAGKDRQFTILGFEHRWWDINNVFDPITGHSTEVDDNHAMFIITPIYETFPESIQMIRG